MLPESDLNLLQAYLDDGLSSSEVQGLDGRISDEPELSAALDALRVERAARVAVFQSLAPPEEQAGRFADSLVASLRQRPWRARVGRASRMAVGIAACMVLSFMAGWLGRGQPGKGTAVAPPPVETGAHARAADSHLVLHTPKPAETGQFQVAVLDENGNVIVVQHFARLEEARQFADDLGQYEVRRQQVQDGQAMLVSDRF